MKYVIVRCEDLGGPRDRSTSLLEGAKVVHLQQLAQAGAAGLIARRGQAAHEDRLHLHRGLLGLGMQEPEAAPARCYAASTDVPIGSGETAWCCELVTHRDGKIIDAGAGRIRTKESEVLLRALTERLGSPLRQWITGQDASHVLKTRDEALQAGAGAGVRSPELLVGQAWRSHLPKGQAGKALAELIEEAARILEDHPINRVRVDLGENPANMIWLWGAADGGMHQSFRDRTGLSGAVASGSFALKGLAKAFGMKWHDAPALSQEAALRKFVKPLAGLVQAHDLTYVHFSIDSADPVDRLCAMERLDQIIVKPLTDQLAEFGGWRFAAAIDDQPAKPVAFVAIGSGLPQQPVAHLTGERLAASPLAFDGAAPLFAWLTQRG